MAMWPSRTTVDSDRSETMNRSGEQEHPFPSPQSTIECTDCESEDGKVTKVTYETGKIYRAPVCEDCIIEYVMNSNVAEIDRVRLS